MNLKEIGEFGFIKRFQPLFENLLSDDVVGIGDDCAIISKNDQEDWLISTDLLVEDVHFLKDSITPYQLGYKALAVNLSDVAAMGGTPVASFLSIAIPSDVSVEYLDELMRGYHALSEKYQTPLLGGDTTKSLKNLVINVGVIGKCAKGKARTRAMAQLGDIICVTGKLGDSVAGLKTILDKLSSSADIESLRLKHHLPEPQLLEGQFLIEKSGVHAMMDISDGIASDLNHILRASNKSAVIDVDKLPISDLLQRVALQNQWNATELALSGGEDYELLLTVAPEVLNSVQAEFLSHIGKPLIPIGRIEDGRSEIHYRKGNQNIEITKNGFNHFV